jgi:hypothetical protein
MPPGTRESTKWPLFYKKKAIVDVHVESSNSPFRLTLTKVLTKRAHAYLKTAVVRPKKAGNRTIHDAGCNVVVYFLFFPGARLLSGAVEASPFALPLSPPLRSVIAARHASSRRKRRI